MVDATWTSGDSTVRWTRRRGPGEDSGLVDNNSSPSFGTKLLAISGTLALIAYMLIGFLLDGWAWGWVVFLIPGAIRAWQAVGQPKTPAEISGAGAGHGAGSSTSAPSVEADPSHEGHEPGDTPPPPQRYQG